ncbi:phosphoribosylamine--glycine ligase [Patescibacteria group bacterium]|nr:phosphoribosylamine--glycine ligase [Patescibacteria group bacterium]
MDILIIGGGGREHALAWKIKQSPKCGVLYIAPGNAGTKALGQNVVLDIKNNQAVVDFAVTRNIGLVVVGPDDYLAQGMTDALSAAGIPAFGASQAASRLEWSKAFAKEFMNTYGIPTAKSETFSDFAVAGNYINEQKLPIVIKADGLALGKGVVIAHTHDEAHATLRSFMHDAKFGESGKTVVVEEFLEGNEVSLHAFCDGETARLFPVARDHKRIGDGNTGANTGGMGTIAPIEVSEAFLDDVRDRVVLPVVGGMKEKGQPFSGVLFPGLMVLKDGTYRVLEFNARFGDPECESYMRLLESDIVDIMFACTQKKLADTEIRWSKKSVVTVILASGGYPDTYEKGFPISGIQDAESDPDVVVFHAGTAEKNGEVVSAGGRVLAVSAKGDTREKAKEKAYTAANKITFSGKQNRADIGAFWAL